MPLSPLPSIRGQGNTRVFPAHLPTDVDITPPLHVTGSVLPKILKRVCESPDDESRGGTTTFSSDCAEDNMPRTVLWKQPRAAQAASVGWAEMSPQRSSEAMAEAKQVQDKAENGCVAADADPTFEPKMQRQKIGPMHVSTRSGSLSLPDLESGLGKAVTFNCSLPPTVPQGLEAITEEIPNESPPPMGKRRTSMFGGGGGGEGKGRRASIAMQAATHLSAGANTVSSLVTRTARRASVALGLAPKTKGPEMRSSRKKRAVGNEVHAFLSMVEGGDGDSITRDQYATLLRADLKRLKLGSIESSTIENMLTAIFGNESRLDHEGFERLLKELHFPIGNLHRCSTGTMESLRRESTADTLKPSLLRRIKSAGRKIFDDNGYQLWVMVYVMITVGLASDVYISRKGWLPPYRAEVVGAWDGELVNIARVFGMLLNFNCALVLVPMFRAILTYLQGTWLTNYVPFEKAYGAHQVIGAIVFGLSLAHGAAHVVNLSLWTGWSFQGSLWCGSKEDGFLFCSAVSGILLQVVFCVMMFFSLPYFRNSKHFNSFWTIHHLAMVFFIILLLHARVFWKWFLPVILGYVLDHILRRQSAKFLSTVLFTQAKGDKVMQIKFTKPAALNYQAGQYVFLKSVAVSKYEWHPFTLTSTPDEDFLECHIKAVGDWTSDLHEHYDSKAIVDGKPVFSLPSHMLQVDGPHGAPAQDWSQFESAVLISAGIGVTPFASIIKHVTARMKQCRILQDAGVVIPRWLTLKVKKVHFIWICRTQESLKWFTDVIAQAKHELADNFQIHVYLSTVSALGDVTAGLTHVAMHAYYKKEGRDAITNLDTLTNYDRPQWKNLFSQLAANHAGERVGVFFCGPHSLGKSLEKRCAEATKSTTTTFTFAKENF